MILHCLRLVEHNTKARKSRSICSLKCEMRHPRDTQHSNAYLSIYCFQFQSVSVPTNVVTVTPVKPVNTVTTLNPSSLGTASAPSNELNLKTENSAAAQANLSPVSPHLHLI